MKWMALVIFGGMGLTALIGGLMWGARRVALFRNGVATQGKVVANDESSSTDSHGRTHVSYYPVVEFQPAQGGTVRFKGSTGSPSPDFETGAAVNLRYNPKNPQEAQLTNFSQFWLGPVAITAAGLIALFLGIGSFLVMGGDDKGFAGMRTAMERQLLSSQKDAVRIEGRIREVRRKENGRYVFVCTARKPGADFEDEFESDSFNFDPGTEYAGRTVTICLDPYNKGSYSVELGPLLLEIVRKQSR
ncbi:MAG TPA: DUF3592 domain-containing protein [Candidatus Edwardsbacteria bacterium]|nr:DUF3592 domain-containing protein [Candidatus Edwardsbacteria bacterium]